MNRCCTCQACSCFSRWQCNGNGFEEDSVQDLDQFQLYQNKYSWTENTYFMKEQNENFDIDANAFINILMISFGSLTVEACDNGEEFNQKARDKTFLTKVFTILTNFRAGKGPENNRIIKSKSVLIRKLRKRYFGPTQGPPQIFNIDRQMKGEGILICVMYSHG